jgi:predicted DNA-binding transcriptional regulator AlpA
MTKQLMNLTEVAQHLGMPYRTLYNMVRQGRFSIPSVKGITPAKWLRADIDALLTSRREG